jgi:hypothetical protein
MLTRHRRHTNEKSSPNEQYIPTIERERRKGKKIIMKQLYFTSKIASRITVGNQEAPSTHFLLNSSSNNRTNRFSGFSLTVSKQKAYNRAPKTASWPASLLARRKLR